MPIHNEEKEVEITSKVKMRVTTCECDVCQKKEVGTPEFIARELIYNQDRVTLPGWTSVRNEMFERLLCPNCAKKLFISTEI